MTIADDSPGGRTARRNWARFIKKVGACPEERSELGKVDPLLCPECGQTMRLVACIEDRLVIRRILIHLRLWEEPEPRPPPIIGLPAPVDIEYIPCYE